MNITELANKKLANENSLEVNDNNQEPQEPEDKKVSALLVVLIIGLAIGIIYVVGNVVIPSEEPNTDPDIVDVEDEGDVEDGDKVIVDKSDKDKVEKPSEKPSGDSAKDNLMNPDKPVESPDKGKAALAKGMDRLEDLAKSNESYDAKKHKEMGRTPYARIDQLQRIVSLGYNYSVDKSEWFQGSNETVQQFVLVMTKDGADDVIVSGNYLLTTDEIQVARIEGYVDLSDDVSPGNGDNFSQGPSDEDLKRLEEEASKKNND